MVFLSKEEVKEMEDSVQSKNCKTELNNKNGIGRSVHFTIFYNLVLYFFILTLSKNLLSAFPENVKSKPKIYLLCAYHLGWV